MLKRTQWILIPLLTLVGLLTPKAARADVNLYVPSIENWSYIKMATGDVYGGTPKVGTGGATLGSQDLAFLFCLEYYTNIYVPGNYFATQVNSAGQIHSANLSGAGQVAWLLNEYAWNPTVATFNSNAAIALQAAIWHVTTLANPTPLALANSAPQFALYTSMLAALGSKTADVSDYLWITPKMVNFTGAEEYQGLVAAYPSGPHHNNVPVPETAGLLSLAIGVTAAGIARKFA